MRRINDRTCAPARRIGSCDADPPRIGIAQRYAQSGYFFPSQRVRSIKGYRLRTVPQFPRPSVKHQVTRIRQGSAESMHTCRLSVLLPRFEDAASKIQVRAAATTVTRNR
jgi:hypothetical protein